jgi:hypothetical protein
MSAEENSQLEAGLDERKVTMEAPDLRAADGGSHRGEDILSLQDLDPALNMKMHLVNNVSHPTKRLSNSINAPSNN